MTQPAVTATGERPGIPSTPPKPSTKDAISTPCCCGTARRLMKPDFPENVSLSKARHHEIKGLGADLEAGGQENGAVP